MSDFLGALEPEKQRLLDALLAAHHEAVFRDNISSATVVNAMTGSGSYIQAIGGGNPTRGGFGAAIGWM